MSQYPTKVAAGKRDVLDLMSKHISGCGNIGCQEPGLETSPSWRGSLDLFIASLHLCINCSWLTEFAKDRPPLAIA